MSSKIVRQEINAWILANIPSEPNVIDLTAQYLNMSELLAKESIGRNDPWLGIQFIGAGEEPSTLYANNTNGCYRETGSVFLHVVDRAKDTVLDDLLTRIETIRNKLRGQRINDIVVQGVTPPNFESGATLQLEGGYQSASIIINFYRDLQL